MLKLADEAQEEIGVPTLDEVAHQGARRMLAQALDVEVAAYVERHKDAIDAAGHRMVVRNGQSKERTITCGAGTFSVKAPRVNDKRIEDGSRQRFTSRILPPYMRRSPKVAEVLPVLYLRGLYFQPALTSLLGENAAGLSATNA